MGYTEGDTIRKLSKEINSPEFIYKSDVVNYTGKTVGTKLPYTEVCSLYMCENMKSIFGENGKKIKIINREQGYFVEGHDGIIKEFTNRGEEILAKAVYLKDKDIPKLGFVFDYQIPLKQSNKDAKVGKIDMVSINEEGIISLIELKAAKSNETLLRCALEIYTYSKQINKEIFINDIKNSYINKFKEKNDLRSYFNKFINDDNKLEKIQSVVLIFEGSTPANMVDPNTYPKTNELVKKLGVKVYVYPADITFTAFADFEEPSKII